MFDQLNETDVKNLKGEVEDLESGNEEQRRMISQLNESRRSGQISVKLIIVKAVLHETDRIDAFYDKTYPSMVSSIQTEVFRYSEKLMLFITLA